VPSTSTAAAARIVRASTQAQSVPERLEDAQTALKIGRILSRTVAEKPGGDSGPAK